MRVLETWVINNNGTKDVVDDIVFALNTEEEKTTYKDKCLLLVDSNTGRVLRHRLPMKFIENVCCDTSNLQYGLSFSFNNKETPKEAALIKACTLHIPTEQLHKIIYLESDKLEERITTIFNCLK